MNSNERKERKERMPHLYQGKNQHNTKKKKEKCCGGNPIIESDGEIVIAFTRQTWNIPFPLPFGFWGTLYINNKNGFGSALAPYLPTGVTVTTNINQNTGDLIFTYTDGINIDTIALRIPSILINYAETVESINTTYMKSNYALLQVNAAIGAPFLQNDDIFNLLDPPFIMTKVSALSNTGGSKTRDIIIPRSRMTPSTTMPNIVELHLRHQNIKPDTIWITKFAYVVFASEPPPITNFLTVFINDIVDLNEDPEQAN